MIYLKKGQTLFDNPNMVVYDPTGYYDDGTSVVCSPSFAPEEPACRYEAKYVAYGGLVYSISDPEELMKQILEIDPNTLFGKDSKQVSIDKVVEAIIPQETSNPDEILSARELNLNNEPTTKTPDEILPINNATSTSSATSTPASSGDVLTSTPNIDASTAATTSSAVVSSVGTSNSTSTSSGTSTSTPASTPASSGDVSTSTSNIGTSTSATTTSAILSSTDNINSSATSTPPSPIDLIVDAVSALTDSK